MMCRHTLSVANRIFNAAAAVVIGVVLLLASGCPKSPAHKTAAKEGPVRTSMTLLVTVRDERGNPLKDALVYWVHKEPKEHTAPTRQKAVVVIAKSAFHPFVLPAPLGTSIRFTNRDKVLHHIYSISEAKAIDILLNKGASSAPVRLNKAGIVVLGCAIHDRMVGYLYAMEYKHFSLTGAEGTAELAGLPFRAVDIRLWHPSMTTSSEEITKRVSPSPDGRVGVDFVVSLQGTAGHESSPHKSPAVQR